MLSHLISIVILSVVPLLRANSDVSEASSSDIQLDQKKEHSRKFYEILQADTIGKQLKGEVTNKYWMMDDASYRETIRQIEAGLAEPGLDKLAYLRRHTLIKNYEVLEIMNIKKIIKKEKKKTSRFNFWSSMMTFSNVSTKPIAT